MDCAYLHPAALCENSRIWILLDFIFCELFLYGFFWPFCWFGGFTFLTDLQEFFYIFWILVLCQLVQVGEFLLGHMLTILVRIY